jgi:hypothetical protein
MIRQQYSSHLRVPSRGLAGVRKKKRLFRFSNAVLVSSHLQIAWLGYIAKQSAIGPRAAPDGGETNREAREDETVVNLGRPAGVCAVIAPLPSKGTHTGFLSRASWTTIPALSIKYNGSLPAASSNTAPPSFT